MVRASAEGPPGEEATPPPPLPPQQPSDQQQPKGRRRRRQGRPPKEEAAAAFTLEDLNPISMGRKSREVFDDVWAQLQRIGNPTRSVAFDDLDVAFG